MNRLPPTTLPLLLALGASAQAVENTCEVAESGYALIITNLTSNNGCETASMAKLCRDFMACVEKQPICLVSNGRVRGGRAARDFSPASSRVTFGARRLRDAQGRESCFIASLSAAPGEDSPSWSYMLFNVAQADSSRWTNKPGKWLRTMNDFLARSEQAAQRRADQSPAQAR